jgi:hypothetical protein
VPTAAEDLVDCPSCHEQIRGDARRCEFCGAEIEIEDEGQAWDAGSAPSGRRDAEPHRGTLVLVLGITSIVVPLAGLILGITAVILGRRDLRKMREDAMDPEGQSVTQAGWICGIIGTCLQSILCLGCGGYIALVTAIGINMTQQIRIQQNQQKGPPIVVPEQAPKGPGKQPTPPEAPVKKL